MTDIELDATDHHIIAELTRDGRLSFTDLAALVHLSTSAAHQRVRRLEQHGVIRRFTAVVDPEAAGLPVTALLSLTPFDPGAPDDIPDRLAHISAIEACWSVAGAASYVLLVRVSRPSVLEGLIAEIRSTARCSTTTTMVLTTPWEHRGAFADWER
ncbi:transcriptional regulator, AsnC family [Kytococcus aerolatus]|uniref:Transcriptional regulator, AsnC family n=1 Tax=Kytococcus aerolatus TaxID=592308 RepID=A0A212T1Q4_9MICO|nr:Lrp/AsnC family transcriptional regulator [Kytococcus aerolatus]SNC59982.1 transcriptional regulator, AsnC family [Kytococcus aerolatus]